MGLLDGMEYDTTRFEIESDGLTQYAIGTIGYLNGEQVDGHDTIDEEGGFAKGHVNGGKDVYSASNVMKGIAFGDEIGDYQITLNGQEVKPYHINAETMRIRTSADEAPYDFIVVGTIWGGKHTNKEDHVETLLQGERGGIHRVRGGVLNGGMDEWYIDGWAPWPQSNQRIMVQRDSRELAYQGNPPIGVVNY